LTGDRHGEAQEPQDARERFIRERGYSSRLDTRFEVEDKTYKLAGMVLALASNGAVRQISRRPRDDTVNGMTDSESEIPKGITSRHQKIIVGFRRRKNNTGNIADVRRLADVKAGDPYARLLVVRGLMKNTFRDEYQLTPTGQALANLLIEREAKK